MIPRIAEDMGLILRLRAEGLRPKECSRVTTDRTVGPIYHGDIKSDLQESQPLALQAQVFNGKKLIPFEYVPHGARQSITLYLPE